MSYSLHLGFSGINRDSQGNTLFTYLPLSKRSLTVCRFLFRRGWIRNYQVVFNSSEKKRVIFVSYKYYSYRNNIFKIIICSSFGNRNYCTYKQLFQLCSRNKSGMYYILSTSKGLLSSSEALSIGIGGELLCRIMY